MFELFPDQPVYEYPQLFNITYAFLWAFILSSIIAITHKVTYTGNYYPRNFFQSLILGSLVTTMVMMAVGDSLARGLGVFGAMAIIRFRTRVNDPRDVLFLFAALSAGLAIGVYGFTISFTGCILFCTVAFILHVSPFRSSNQMINLSFSLSSAKQLPAILSVIHECCSDCKMTNFSINKENILQYQYAIGFRKNAGPDKLIEALCTKEGIMQIKVSVAEIV